ncbi:hypothetical protein SNEBB_005738 [Seison nebaliae]|nr:hypothetical protein SNEBB_005738 [Seison nebaliae]
MIDQFLKYTGLVTLLSFTWFLVSTVSQIIIYHGIASSRKRLTKLVEIDGVKTWAIVTGATDGIGLAIADELAKMGFNVLLISRTVSKLENVKADLMEKYENVKIEWLSMDFTDSSHDNYKEVISTVNKLNVTVLVNNVGMSFEPANTFLDEIKEREFFPENIVNCNVMSLVKMTKICLPQMKEKNCGVVINMASAAALTPSPLLGLYSASKIFVDYFSRTLAMELRDTDISIETVLPFFVATKMSGISEKRKSFFVSIPSDYANSVLNSIRPPGAITRAYGNLPHSLQALFLNIIPESIRMKLIMKTFSDQRTRALMKRERQQRNEELKNKSS